MCDTNCPRCKNALRSPEEIVREKERERETAGGGLANCQGKEDGWGARGWSWARERYGGIFAQKSPYLMHFFADFVFSEPDPVATQDKEPKTHVSRKRLA